MDARDVIKRPIITEASMLATDEMKYTFEVDVRKQNRSTSSRRRNFWC